MRSDHHCLGDKESDLSLSDKDSLSVFLDSRIIDIVLLRSRLKVFQSFMKLVCFARRLALLRFLIYLLIDEVIHGGSDGRIVTILFGMQSF